MLSSLMLRNTDGKGFQISALPEIAQISAVNDILTEDLNEDGFLDMILVGNMYAQETLFGRYDASLGTILLGDGQMNWRPLGPDETNFVVDGDARKVGQMTIGKKKSIIVTQNNGPVLFFEMRRRARESYAAKFRPRLLQ